MHLSIKLKLGMSFAALTFVMLLVCVLAMVALDKSDQAFSEYVKGVNARDQLASGLLIAAQQRAVAARNIVLVSSEADLKLERAAVLTAQRVIQTRLEDLNRTLSSEAETQSEKPFVAEIARIEGLYRPVALDIVAHAIAGQREEASLRINRDCIPLLRQLLAAGEAYMQHNREAAHEALIAGHRKYESQRNLMIAICAGAMLFGLGLGVVIIKSLFRILGDEPLDLSAAARYANSGDICLSPDDKF